MKIRSFRRFVATALCLSIVAGSLDLPILSGIFGTERATVYADGGYSSWQELKNAIEHSSGDNTFTLSDDITAEYDEDHITIVQGNNVTIDLNGHTLDRVLPSGYNGYFFDVSGGSLTISGGSGVIQGASNNRSGGAIIVEQGGSLYLSGGTIMDNHSADDGGAVYCVNGSVTLEGSKILDNYAEGAGGGIYMANGTLTLKSGVISDNRSEQSGYGIAVSDDADIRISGNGRVLSITGNHQAGNELEEGNIYLQSGKTIYIDNAPASTSEIGIRTFDSPSYGVPVVIAEHVSTDCSSVFRSDIYTSRTFRKSGNTIVMADEQINTWYDLQNAMNAGGIQEYDGGELIRIIRLTSDIKATSSDGPLVFEYNYPVILDLCGHKIDRNLTSPAADGYVLKVEVGKELIIRDSSSGKTGSIRGGNNTGNGGGIFLYHGSLVFESGTIEDNTAGGNGGGIYAVSAELTQKAGVIKDNTALHGGGVFFNGDDHSSYSITSSASVTGNKSSHGDDSNVFLMDGSILTVEDDLTGSASIGIDSASTGAVTVTDGFAAYYGVLNVYDIFSSDDTGHCLALNDDHEVTVVTDGHTEGEPVWTWSDDYSSAHVTVSCTNCGKVLFDKDADSVTGPSYDSTMNKIVFTATADLGGTAVTNKIACDPQPEEIAASEPYVDLTGKYVLGNTAYYELTLGDDVYLFSKVDGHPGDIISEGDTKLSYFVFDNTHYTIVSYTGSAADIQLPSYSDAGKPMHKLGTSSVPFFADPQEGTGYVIHDHNSITEVYAEAFEGVEDLTLYLGIATEVFVHDSFDEGSSVKLFCSHKSGLPYGENAAQRYTVDYIDAHTCTVDMGRTTWAEDYSSAEVYITCACGFETSLHTTDITRNVEDGKLNITATASFGSKTYTAVLEDVAVFRVTLTEGGEATGTYLIPRSYVNGSYRTTASFNFDLLASELTVPSEYTALAGFRTGEMVYQPDASVIIGSDMSYEVIWNTVWSSVESALATAEPGTDIDITLYGDLRAGAGDSYLYVPEGVNVSIDLNGHTIDRGLAIAAENGYVFRTDGTLMLKNGTVTGGYNYGNGGAVYVNAGGKLYLLNTELADNHAVNGSGIFLEEGIPAEGDTEAVAGGIAYMYGGQIITNLAKERGGGVYVSCAAKIYMTTLWSDLDLPPALSFTGSETAVIEDNVALIEGGGIYIKIGGEIYLNGSVQVVNNTGGDDGDFNNICPDSDADEKMIVEMIKLGAALTLAAIICLSIKNIKKYGSYIALATGVVGLGILAFIFLDVGSSMAGGGTDQRDIKNCKHIPRRNAVWDWDQDYKTCRCTMICGVCGNTCHAACSPVPVVDDTTKVTSYTGEASDSEGRTYTDGPKTIEPYKLVLKSDDGGPEIQTKTILIPHEKNGDGSNKPVAYSLMIPAEFRHTPLDKKEPEKWVCEQTSKEYPVTSYESVTELTVDQDLTLTLKWTIWHEVSYKPGAEDCEGSMEPHTVDIVMHEKSYTILDCGWTRAKYDFAGWEVTMHGVPEAPVAPGKEYQKVECDISVTALWKSKWSKFGERMAGEPVLALGEDLTAVETDTYLSAPAGHTVEVDLGGKTLDRALTVPTAGGNAIVVSGGLALKNGTVRGGAAAGGGSGIRVNAGAALRISGYLNITQNLNDNVYLASGTLLTVEDTLDPNTRIGVSMQSPGVFTSGLAGRGSASNFISDDSRYTVRINDDGEAYLSLKVTFDKGDPEASGIMPDDYVTAGSTYILPFCAYTAPEGKRFKEWLVVTGDAAPATKHEADPITVTDNTLVTAIWEDIPEYATIESATVSFDEELKLNYYIDIPESLRDGSYAVLTCGEDSETIYVADAEYFDTDDAKGFKFSYTLLAQQIEDVVNIRIYDKYGSLITLMNPDGTHDYTDSGIDYTILRYVDYMIIHGSDTMKALAQAAKDYCYTARNHFTGSECPVSEAVDAVQLGDLDAYISKRSGTMPEGVSIDSISALFESDNSFRLYLKFSGVDPKDLTFKLDGSDTGLETIGNMRYLTFTDVVSTKLDEEHTFTVSDGTSTFDLTVSVLTYARAVVGQSSSDTMVSLAKALYLYSKAADMHFKTN